MLTNTLGKKTIFKALLASSFLEAPWSQVYDLLSFVFCVGFNV